MFFSSTFLLSPSPSPPPSLLLLFVLLDLHSWIRGIELTQRLVARCTCWLHVSRRPVPIVHGFPFFWWFYLYIHLASGLSFGRYYITIYVFFKIIGIIYFGNDLSFGRCWYIYLSNLIYLFIWLISWAKLNCNTFSVIFYDLVCLVISRERLILGRHCITSIFFKIT